MNSNDIFGFFLILLGLAIIMFVISDLIVRGCTAFFGLLLINWGLRLRGLPPLQILLPLLARRRWF